MDPTKEYTGRSKISMYNADCMDLMNTGKEWDLAIVDPPYGIGATVTIGAGDKRTGIKVESKWDNKDWDNTIPDKKYFYNLTDLSNNQIIWGGNYFTKYLKPSPCWLIWDKVQRIKLPDAEMAWASFDTGIKIFKYARGNMQGFRNPNRFHPTEKPVQLYKWLLTNYANEGDKILDTHGGSMSISIACWDLGFDLDICELDTDYFNDAVKRFENHISQTQLF